MKKQWNKHVEHVENVPQKMWKWDGLMDNILESSLFTVNMGSSDVENTDESDSDVSVRISSSSHSG